MLPDSRMNLAGLLPRNVGYVADAIAAERFDIVDSARSA
jgi:hypothetical protein